MKFVDEAVITVQAGRGGDGSLSFRREKFVPRGGPDGGDGGDGGDIVLTGREGLNTLVDLRHASVFKADSGRSGAGANRSGRNGAGLVIEVPPGTRVHDRNSGEIIGEITVPGQRLPVARGGAGGCGNARFKSSVNRSPRRTTPGHPGDRRELRLELIVLADVGLVGLPNAGKSTLLRALSRARPRVADYPFTTLHPILGVVSIEPGRSFVLADIPGLIAGASRGVGLGARFLRHLERTRLFLHIVDIAPLDPAITLSAVHDIERELVAFNPALASRERWLVLNKTDLVPPQEMDEHCTAIVIALAWRGPVMRISGATGNGCLELAQAVMRRIEAHAADGASGAIRTEAAQ